MLLEHKSTPASITKLTTSCLTTCWKTEALSSWKIGKYYEKIKNWQGHSLVPSFPSKNEVLEIVLKRKTKSKPTWILFLPTTRLKIVELEYYLSAKHCKKLKISIKNLFSKCDHIGRKLQVWPHLLKKALMENFSFCAIQRHKSVKGCRYYLVSSRVEPPRFFSGNPHPFGYPSFSEAD